MRPPSGSSVERAEADAVDAVVGEARRRRRTPRRRRSRAGSRRSGRSAPAPPMRKSAGIAEADRQHRPGEVRLVGVAVQAHARLRAVVVDEAAVGHPLARDQRAPDREHARRDRRPGRAGRVAVDVAVALAVGEPAVAPGRGHPHAHRLAPRRQRREERRGVGDGARCPRPSPPAPAGVEPALVNLEAVERDHLPDFAAKKRPPPSGATACRPKARVLYSLPTPGPHGRVRSPDQGCGTGAARRTRPAKSPLERIVHVQSHRYRPRHHQLLRRHHGRQRRPG